MLILCYTVDNISDPNQTRHSERSGVEESQALIHEIPPLLTEYGGLVGMTGKRFGIIRVAYWR